MELTRWRSRDNDRGESMVHVNGKEMIFGTWFTIQNDGSAVADLPVFPGQTMRFEIKPWTGEPPTPQNERDKVDRMNWEQGVSLKQNGNELHFLMPYLLEYKSHVQVFNFEVPAVGKVEGHLIRQQVSGAMLVHVALYLERSPNYRPK
jgi:hypothetical protein